MMNWKILTLFAVMCSTTPAFAQLQLFGAASQLQVVDDVSDGENTMSGSHEHRIRTNTLFAGFQLLDSEKTDSQIDLGQELKHAPIWLPTAVNVAENNLFLCAAIKSINGYYLADGYAPLSSLDQSSGQGMQPLPFQTEYSKQLKDEYPETFLLPRMIVANDCDTLRSQYYVPVSWSADPDQLLVVVEIGAATVEATLRPVGADGKVVTGKASELPLDCTPSLRVSAGYDCIMMLPRTPATSIGAFELSVTIDRQGIEPVTRQAYLSLPRRL